VIGRKTIYAPFWDWRNAMKLAVLSDSHDNIWKLDQAMPHLASCGAVIHCGDIISPFMLRRLGEGLGEIPLHVVWGNNDGDRFLLRQVASGFSAIQLHGELAEISYEGVAIAANHYPLIADGLARSGKYGLVCYGHDHTAHESRLGKCLLLNPGELMGLNGRSSLAIVDLPALTVEWIDLSPSE
jgi:putative phosphoesterase